MVRGEMFIRDHGPLFLGLAVIVSGRLVCVAAPSYKKDPVVQRTVRTMVRRLGGDCGTCRNCPIGRDD